MPVPMTAHIRLDDRGVAWIDDTNTKVIEVALDMIAHGWRSGGGTFSAPAPVVGTDSRRAGLLLRSQGRDGRGSAAQPAGGGAVAGAGR